MLLRRPVIAMVTDRKRLPADEPDAVVRLVGAASRAGVDLVQLRERDLPDRELFDLACRILAVTAPSTALVVNDRLDVALAARAHGVHLRADSITADRVRAVVPPGFLIGRSVHTPEEAVQAAGTGVDYVIFGTVFPTASKGAGATVTGTAPLAKASAAVRVPVLAIGGIVADKGSDIAAAGAAGLAAIGLFSDLFAEHRHDQLEAALAEVVSALRRPFLQSR